MKNFDVILTTYQVVTREYADSGAANVDHASQVPKKKRKKGTKSLFDVHWKVSTSRPLSLCNLVNHTTENHS